MSTVFSTLALFLFVIFIFKIDYKTANFKPIQISILGQILRLRLGLSFYIITFFPLCTLSLCLQKQTVENVMYWIE